MFHTIMERKPQEPETNDKHEYMNSSVTEGQKKVNFQYFDDFWQSYSKYGLEMFEYMSEGIEKLTYIAFVLFVRGLANAPQVL